MALSLNPALQHLPVYQPGRPIEEVARELGRPAASIIKLASNENPLGPSPAALAAMETVLKNLHLSPHGKAFYRLGLHTVRVLLHSGAAYHRVRQPPGFERGRWIGAHLREMADAAPLSVIAVIIPA